jgi:hypothetical protein
MSKKENPEGFRLRGSNHTFRRFLKAERRLQRNLPVVGGCGSKATTKRSRLQEDR